MKIHDDFKSIVPNIPNARKLYQLIKKLIPFSINCPRGKPTEDTRLSDIDVNKFKIDFEHWDRLYYFEEYNDDYDRTYIFYGRMEKNGKLLFFEFYIRYNLGRLTRAHVFMSSDANLFLNSVIDHSRRHPLIGPIRRSLDDDGIHLDENLEGFLDYYNKMTRKLYPFQNLTSGNLKKYFQEYRDLFPAFLIRRVDDFKKFSATRDYYDCDSWTHPSPF